MSARSLLARCLRDTRGFTMVEMLIAAVVFVFVASAVGALYLSTRQGFNYSSAEAFAQRQGTLVQQRLTRELQSATSIQVAKCAEASPGTMPANTSIIYGLSFPGRTGNQTEYWCIYQFQRASFSPFSQLWRCPLANASASQTCTGGAANAENLMPPVPDSVAGERLEVLNSNFAFTASCGGSPCLSTSVNLRFDVDLHAQTTTASLLASPRRFGFTVAVRN